MARLPFGLEPTPRMRVSDAEREHVAEFLRDHCAAGRLTPEELSDRLDRTYHARFEDELAPLCADLPALRPRAAASAPRSRAARAWRQALVAAIVVSLAFLAVKATWAVGAMLL